MPDVKSPSFQGCPWQGCTSLTSQDYVGFTTMTVIPQTAASYAKLTPQPRSPGHRWRQDPLLERVPCDAVLICQAWASTAPAAGGMLHCIRRAVLLTNRRFFLAQAQPKPECQDTHKDERDQARRQEQLEIVVQVKNRRIGSMA